MTLDIRSVLHFVVVAEEKSFTRAAARLGLAQPWLSQRIRAFEAQLGFPLFTRTTRYVELTQEGAAFLAVAEPLAGISEELERLIRRLGREKGTGRFRVGATPHGNRVSMRNRLMAALTSHYPRVSIELEVGWTPHLCDRVRGGDLDAAFALGPIDETKLDVVPIGALQRLFVLETRDPLRKQRSIGPADLAGRKVAAFSRGVNPALFDTTFQPLVDAGAELIPVDLDGQPLVEGKSPGPLIFSYFGGPAANARRGERLLDGASPVPLNFVSRLADRNPVLETARMIARLLRDEGST